MAEIGTDISKASLLLESGALVAIPTETVYGLAANALNQTAVLNIFKAKQRPSFDPLIVHVSNIHEVEKYAHWHDENLKKLAQLFWPGPLTILLPKQSNIPDIVTSGLDQVALRVPQHAITLSLLKQLSFPLAAPSANPFGYISPTTAKHVQQQLNQQIDYILDGGPSQIGLESTIVGSENNQLCVYRLGGLAIEDIERVVGQVEIKLNQSSNPLAPGQLKSHYAPKKPLYLGQLNELIKKHGQQKLCVLAFGAFPHQLNQALVFNLSESRNLNEAALNLFKMMRLADESDANVIISDYLPDTGLGRAINDRLKRAATDSLAHL